MPSRTADLRRDAQAIARRLHRERMPLASALAECLQATMASDGRAARHHRRNAQAVFEELSMPMFGELVAGRDAAAYGVVDAERLRRLLAGTGI